MVGIDGGGLDDLFGLAVLGRDKDSRAGCYGRTHGATSACSSGASRSHPGSGLRGVGELTIVDDRLETFVGERDHPAVRSEGHRSARAVAIDPAGIGELVDALAEIDVTQANELLVGVGQGYRMMSAIKTTERRLATGTFRHSGSSLMAWCVSNLRIEPTATAIRATKQHVATRRSTWRWRCSTRST